MGNKPVSAYFSPNSLTCPKMPHLASKNVLIRSLHRLVLPKKHFLAAITEAQT